MVVDLDFEKFCDTVIFIKSKVDRPWKIKYLGFSVYQAKGKVGIRIFQKSIAKFKDKIRVITSRSNAMSMKTRYLKLK